MEDKGLFYEIKTSSERPRTLHSFNNKKFKEREQGHYEI